MRMIAWGLFLVSYASHELLNLQGICLESMRSDAGNVVDTMELSGWEFAYNRT